MPKDYRCAFCDKRFTEYSVCVIILPSYEQIISCGHCRDEYFTSMDEPYRADIQKILFMECSDAAIYCYEANSLCMHAYEYNVVSMNKWFSMTTHLFDK